MKKLLFSTLIIAFLAVIAFGQDFEYGNPSELKGLTKIYIDTEADIKTRNMIIKELEKAKLKDLVITETPKEAQIIMMYRSRSEKVVQGATQSYGTTILNEATLTSGKGYVFIEGRDKSKARIIINFENSQDNKLEKNPALKFAKEFIKTYKEANGIK